MADLLTITAVVAEIGAFTGARIDRIYQPSRYEVLIYLYMHGEHHPGGKTRLLLSAHPQHSRIHLTAGFYRHPEQPSPFCMLLRKYLTGGVIQAIRQPPLERIVVFTVSSREGLFTVDLIAEIMGRRSNFILTNERGQILGALKRSSLEQNRCRATLNEEIYLPPPVPEKLDPHHPGPDSLKEQLVELSVAGKPPQKALLELVHGVSPLAAEELVYRGRWDPEQPAESARRLVEELQLMFQNSRNGRTQPCWALSANKYAPYRLTHLGSPQKNYRTMNELLDDYYRHHIEQENTGSLRRQLQLKAGKKLARAERKLSEQQQDLKRVENKERFRLYGETLLSFARQIPSKSEQVELPDLYHPERSILIPLDPRLSASGNAQKYFKLYRKAKLTGEKTLEHLKLTRSEIAYWKQLLNEIEEADQNLLQVIRQLLEDPSRKTAAAGKQIISLPLAFRAAEGNTILVGRNQRQNDLLTFKLASRQDTWLHARGLPGSHVLIKDSPYPPPADLLEEAALLAAYFSKGRESTAVEVDYTAIKFVRRSPGRKPGQVLYTNYRTITVRPDSGKLRQLIDQSRDSLSPGEKGTG